MRVEEDDKCKYVPYHDMAVGDCFYGHEFGSGPECIWMKCESGGAVCVAGPDVGTYYAESERDEAEYIPFIGKLIAD